jgi:signal transduction histidine kinase/ActR/RegA family two-component response regulator
VNDAQILIMALAIGGLMLGRRVLWTIYATIVLAYAVGMTTEMLAHHGGLHLLKGAYAALPSMAVSNLLVVIILDRSIHALRTSLVESNTHRRQLQLEIAERERTQEQLLHAQKMDAVGKLASGIAHDINNVLGIVLGFTQERHRLIEPDAEFGNDALALADALEGAELAARRGAAVCRKLLNFSRRDVTHAETFDAAATLGELQPLLRQLLPAKVNLAIDTPTSPLSIHFDRSQFELALLNLASNAGDAMPGGGTCTISLAQEDSSRMVLSVQDTGTGIPEDVKPHIFEPFFTTKPTGSGTGLGLSVVYGLMRRAGGEIVVNSEPGHGTAFHFHLPLANAVTTEVSLALPEGCIRVLLIDDDDDLRALLAAALENGGCEVYEAANGAAAREIVARMVQPPHVLVCDHRMPDIDGATLLRMLRQRLPHVPAILISAYLDTDGSPPGQEDPFSERLPKPFAPDALLSRVLAAASRDHASRATTSAQRDTST